MKPETREAFGDKEYNAVIDCMNYYRNRKQDMPYDGIYQKKFESDFSKKMNGGFSVAVNSGSSASLIALKALEIQRNSTVLMSPVSDSSSFLSICIAGYNPVILDTSENSYNTTIDQVKAKYTKKVKALYLVHSYGVPADILKISNFCREMNIYLIEDCSQAPFASVSVKGKNKYVGEFGDIACFSTMYRKTLNTSSSGGLVFTKDHELYKRSIEYSDRGRKKWSNSVNMRDGGNVDRFSANYNTSEISCAIGISSLERIDDTILKRRELLDYLTNKILKYSKYLRIMEFPKGSYPFLIPIRFTSEGLALKKYLYEIFDKLEVPYAKEYPCFAYDWKCVRNYKKTDRWSWLIQWANNNIEVASKNASLLKNETFNLYVHEGYTFDYLDYVVKSMEQIFN